MTPADIHERLQDIAHASRLRLDDLVEIHQLLSGQSAFTDETLVRELQWFFNELGLNRYYFRTTPRELIARHIESLYAAKILARSSGERLNLTHESESDRMAIYACQDEHAVSARIERRIERKFPRHRLADLSQHACGKPA